MAYPVNQRPRRVAPDKMISHWRIEVPVTHEGATGKLAVVLVEQRGESSSLSIYLGGRKLVGAVLDTEYPNHFGWDALNKPADRSYIAAEVARVVVRVLGGSERDTGVGVHIRQGGVNMPKLVEQLVVARGVFLTIELGTLDTPVRDTESRSWQAMCSWAPEERGVGIDLSEPDPY